MSQMTFSDAEFSQKRRKTRKERFLARMDALIPWQVLEAVVEPHYPKAGNGRRPYPLATMLRIHCLQQWYSLSDPSMEDALYEITPMRQFTNLSLDGPIPDESTIMNFRHLLERHELGDKIFARLNSWLCDHGILLKQGTLVDATIIEAPTSTKNKSGKRDPEMHQTKKGNQWHFDGRPPRMKAHIGVDPSSGLTRSIHTTSANIHDLNAVEHLLCGEEELVLGDAGFQGISKRKELEGYDVEWVTVERPSKLAQWKKHPRINKAEIAFEKAKSSLRARVEHPFRIIKCQFGFTKACYRGLAKNHNKLAMMFALANMVRLDQLCRAQ